MKNTPSIDSLFKLVNDIQDLQKAKDLLQEIWLADGREVKLSAELSRKLDDYFELDQDE